MMRGMLSEIHFCSMGFTMSATMSSSERGPALAADAGCTAAEVPSPLAGNCACGDTGADATTAAGTAGAGACAFEAASPAASASSADADAATCAAASGSAGARGVAGAAARSDPYNPGPALTTARGRSAGGITADG